MKSEFAVDENFGSVRHRTSWQEEGLCRSVDPELFFATRADLVEEAKSVCNSCPVSSFCLSEEVNNLTEGTQTVSDVAGVRAGMTDKERKRFYRQNGVGSTRKAPGNKNSPAKPRRAKRVGEDEKPPLTPIKPVEKRKRSIPPRSMKSDVVVTEEDRVKLELLEQGDVSLGEGAILVRE